MNDNSCCDGVLTGRTSIRKVADPLILEIFAIIRSVAAQVMVEQGVCRVVTSLEGYQDSQHLHWHIISGDRISLAAV